MAVSGYTEPSPPQRPDGSQYQYTEDWFHVAHLEEVNHRGWLVFTVWFSPLDAKFYWLYGTGYEGATVFDGVEHVVDFHRGTLRDVVASLQSFASRYGTVDRKIDQATQQLHAVVR